MPLDEAVERAITECISEGILADFLRKNRAEAKKVSIYEYDEERHMRQTREEGVEEGYANGLPQGIEQTAVNLIKTRLLTDEQIKAFRLADNKVGEIATWDLSALVDELKDINFIDMEDFGFLNADELRTDFFDEEEAQQDKDDKPAQEDNGKVVKVVCDDENYQQISDYLDANLFVYEV